MVVREFYKTRTDGVNLFRTYSDEGKMIIQNETGIEYAEAIDVENAPYTYSESENEIGADENGELSAEEALNIIMGGSV
jgi:hypothetical protein